MTEEPRLERAGDVFVLHLGNGENLWRPEWMRAVASATDEVERACPAALVTTAAGKVWSNGLDLKWFEATPEQRDSASAQFLELLARTLVAAVPTVAALQGHAFGAGALLALCHDYRVMRADAGYICLPEVGIRMTFTDGIAALVQEKISPAAAREMMLGGRRIGGYEAAQIGIVDHAVAAGDVLDRALGLAATLVALHGPTLGAIKRRLYGRAYALLTSETQRLHDITSLG